mmetsp:Transcript_1471/g.4390  ORF Transcript_1471/g.4390 Transcript_1471/m.4390 type:complete len:200 (+) Transcript_1471:184-783(+)
MPKHRWAGPFGAVSRVRRRRWDTVLRRRRRARRGGRGERLGVAVSERGVRTGGFRDGEGAVRRRRDAPVHDCRDPGRAPRRGDGMRVRPCPGVDAAGECLGRLGHGRRRGRLGVRLARRSRQGTVQGDERHLLRAAAVGVRPGSGGARRVARCVQNSRQPNEGRDLRRGLDAAVSPLRRRLARARVDRLSTDCDAFHRG